MRILWVGSSQKIHFENIRAIRSIAIRLPESTLLAAHASLRHIEHERCTVGYFIVPVTLFFWDRMVRNNEHEVAGPEGGFTDEEIASAERGGFQRVSLGPHILRIETAAIAIAARSLPHCSP